MKFEWSASETEIDAFERAQATRGDGWKTAHMVTSGVVIGSAMIFGGLVAPASAQAPAKVAAKYDVSYLGVKVGEFDFSVTRNGTSYQTRGQSKIRLLLGALKWTGALNGSGRYDGSAIQPAEFRQEFVSRRKLLTKEKKKIKSTYIKFAGGKVAKTDLVPPRKTHKRAPLLPQHLDGVLDPAAGVLALTQVRTGRAPCDHRINVFEGRMRFDLVLKPKGRETIKDKDGNTANAFVCDVSYKPVGGHKLNDKGNERMKKSGSIELVLRPVDGVDVYVPHAVRVDTGVGTARLQVRKVDITTADSRKISMAH